MLLAVTEEEDGSSPLLETREFCRKEEPRTLEWRPGLTRRAEGPPLMFEVPVVVIVVDIGLRWWWPRWEELSVVRSLSTGRLRDCSGEESRSWAAVKKSKALE